MFFKTLIGAAACRGQRDLGRRPSTFPAPARPFPFPIYAKWADTYKKETGNGLNYQSIGSGAGIKQIKAKTVTFGATDAPLKAKDLDEAGLAQWPMVMGGIVPVVHLDGVKAGRPDARRQDARRHLPRQDQDLERSRRSRSSTPTSSCPSTADRGHPPRRRLGHDLQLHLLSRRSLAGLEGQGRRRDLGRLAGRHRRQGQ